MLELPWCRVRLASSWAAGLRTGMGSFGMGVWLSNSHDGIAFAHLVLVISAVACTCNTVPPFASRKRTGHMQSLDLSTRNQREPLARYSEEVLFGTIRICNPVSAGPSPLGSPCQGWRHPPWYSPKDRGPRAEGEGGQLGGQLWGARGGSSGGPANMQCTSKPCCLLLLCCWLFLPRPCR